MGVLRIRVDINGEEPPFVLVAIKIRRKKAPKTKFSKSIFRSLRVLGLVADGGHRSGREPGQKVYNREIYAIVVLSLEHFSDTISTNPVSRDWYLLALLVSRRKPQGWPHVCLIKRGVSVWVYKSMVKIPCCLCPVQ